MFLTNNVGLDDITQTKSSEDISVIVMISVILAVVVVLLIIGIVIFIILRRRRQSKDETLAVSVTLDSVQVLKGDIVKGERLGSGNFGDVYKGKWNGLSVALKSLKNEDDIADFEQEAAVLQYENMLSICLFSQDAGN